MKKKSASRSAFFNLRVLIGLFIVLAGVSLALAGLGTFSATAARLPQKRSKSTKLSTSQAFLRDLTVPRFTRRASTEWKALNGDAS